MTTSRSPVRYAVVGAGNIAQVAVLPAFAHARENSKLVAVISGDPEKRAALRERYELEEDGDYGDFESILDGAGVDAVYIATPNTLHKEYALRAAASGVHVLCEKPFAPSVEDCLQITQACEANDVKLMVAYRLHFEEANLKAMEIVRSGKLGDVRLFSSVFTHVVRPGDIRVQASLAGGAAYDLGVYCINAARNLFCAEPVSVYATALKQNDTDDTTMALLTFPGSRVAQFCVSNSVASVSSYRIAGSLGDLRAEPAYEYADENDLHVTVDGKTRSEKFRKRDQFAPELAHFSDCILTDREPEPSGEEGMLDIRVVKAILLSAETRQLVELPPYERRRRPNLGQESRKPAVDKPDTVNAPGPSLR